MKIAIVTPTFPPYAGGIGNVAAYNARELVNLSHEVVVFTPWYEPVTEELKDIKIERIKPVITYGNAALTPGFGRLLLDFDIIHLHYPYFGGAEMIWLNYSKFKKRKIKIVLHYHMDVVGEGLLKAIFTTHTKVILPWIVAIADKVIFTSLDYGQNSNLARFVGKNHDKFIEVPNGVDTLNFKPTTKDQSLLEKYNIEPDTRIVVFVGGLDKAHYFKGIEYLIEAMSRLKEADYNWRLIIVGDGDLRQHYVDFSGQLNIDYKTIFAGYVPNEDLPKYYNLADVVVLPSVDKSEAFGLALVEGMACGKAVVASNLAGVRSVVEDGVNGFLTEPKNADDLASKINYLLTNPAVASGFGFRGREKAEQQYDWKIIGKQLEKIYKGLS